MSASNCDSYLQAGGLLPEEMQFDDEYIEFTDVEEEDEEAGGQEDEGAPVPAELAVRSEGRDSHAGQLQGKVVERGKVLVGQQGLLSPASLAMAEAVAAQTGAAPSRRQSANARKGAGDAASGPRSSGREEAQLGGPTDLPWRIGKTLVVLNLGRVDASCAGCQGTRNVYPVGYK